MLCLISIIYFLMEFKAIVVGSLASEHIQKWPPKIYRTLTYKSHWILPHEKQKNEWKECPFAQRKPNLWFCQQILITNRKLKEYVNQYLRCKLASTFVKLVEPISVLWPYPVLRHETWSKRSYGTSRQRGIVYL